MCGSAEALKKGILRCAQNDRCREGVDPPLRWVLDQIGICRLYKNRSMSSSGTRSGREGSWGGRLKIGVGSKMTVKVTKDFAVSALLLRCPAVSLPTERLRHLPTAATHSGRSSRLRRRSPRSPVAVPGALLADGAAASLTDRGHSDSPRAALRAVARLHGACGRTSLRSLHLPPAALPSLPPSRLFGTFLAETRKVRPRQGPEPSSWEKVMRIRRISFLDNR